MLVGVVSDTHGLLRPEVLQAFAGVDHILHAGDIGNPRAELGTGGPRVPRRPGGARRAEHTIEEVLDALRAVAPVTAVAGNVDGFRCGSARETSRVVLDGVRFFLTHILDRPQAPRPEVIADLARHPADVVVFGHSHLPHDEVLDGVRFLNPASAGPRRFDYPVSVALLQVERGRVAPARFVALDARSKGALARHMNRLSRGRTPGTRPNRTG